MSTRKELMGLLTNRFERETIKKSPLHSGTKFGMLTAPLAYQKDALSVRKAYAEAFKTVPDELKKTLPYNQGKEMSQHEQFTIDTGIQVFFAHPGSPWERGMNENTNGLMRQYFPAKGMLRERNRFFSSIGRRDQRSSKVIK